MASDLQNLTQALKAKRAAALILNEDGVGLSETAAHLKSLGFTKIVVASYPNIQAPRHPDYEVIHLAAYPEPARLLESVIANLNGQWLHFCFTGEFLFYPYAETRTIDDFCEFLAEERRDSAQTTVVDLYFPELTDAMTNSDITNSYFDIAPYYSKPVPISEELLELEKQELIDISPAISVYGGLRWRLAEYFPQDRQCLNRAALIKCQPAVTLNDDLSFADMTLASYKCPWHHSPTTAQLSFRAAKYLQASPAARNAAPSLKWSQSVKCQGKSAQLIDYGFFEYGQWF